MVTKRCKLCEQVLPIEEFCRAISVQNWKGSGNFRHSNRQAHHSYCKPCNAVRAKRFRATYYAKHGAGYCGTNKVRRIPVEDRKLMSLVRGRLTEAKSRVRKFSQTATDLDEDYLFQLLNDQDRKCALTGVPFVVEKKHPLCPSLDKIHSTGGYIKGNVQWLCWAVNRAKGDLDTVDFVEMCRRIVEVSERATAIP